MIAPTEKDVGRRVQHIRNPKWAGSIVDSEGCGACMGRCCKVLYDGDRAPIWTNADMLVWE